MLSLLRFKASFSLTERVLAGSDLTYGVSCALNCTKLRDDLGLDATVAVLVLPLVVALEVLPKWKKDG